MEGDIVEEGGGEGSNFQPEEDAGKVVEEPQEEKESVDNGHHQEAINRPRNGLFEPQCWMFEHF